MGIFRLCIVSALGAVLMMPGVGPASAQSSPSQGSVEVLEVFTVPVVRYDRWSTTYAPGLPFGGLRQVEPTRWYGTRHPVYRNRTPVLSRKG